MALENKKYFSSRLVKRKITSSTDIFSLEHSCSRQSSMNCAVCGKLSLTASNTLEIISTLRLSVSLCGYDSCLCALDLNLKYLNAFIFLWRATPWLIKLPNKVMKWCNWLLNVIAKFFPCSPLVFSFDYLVVVGFFPSTKCTN